MIVANINTEDSPDKMFDSFAEAFGCTVIDDRFVTDGKSMTGFCIKSHLDEGISAFYLKQENKEAVYILLQKSTEEKYIIMFANSSVPLAQNWHIKYGDITINRENTSWKNAFLTSSHQDILMMMPPGFESSNLVFLIDKMWLEKHIDIDFNSRLSTDYIKLKTSAFNLIPLSDETEMLRNKIILLLTQKRDTEEVYRLSTGLLKEYFFSLHLILVGMQGNRLNEEDVSRLVNYIQKQPESELIKPFSRKELGRRLGMSESKLGSLFKTIYGASYSQYIIKRRMEWAAVKIAAGELTVTDAGFALGYENLGQFSATFKKHIKVLPSELPKN